MFYNLFPRSLFLVDPGLETSPRSRSVSGKARNSR